MFIVYTNYGDIMKIEKIQKLKNNKYKIILENNDVINTYDDVILNNNLLFNKDISSELLNQINNQTIYYDCYNKVLKFIDKKLRCEKEISEYIKKINPEYENKIIEKLKQINLINDENYVKSYISDRIFLSNDGPNKIREELLKYNIDESVIEENICKIDKSIIYEKCKKIIDKKVKSNTKYSKFILNQKITSDLLNKGYELDMIREILNLYDFCDNTIIKKEYEKLFNKLSRKYKDKELYSQIKNKLYQKGFSYDEINNYIKTVD